MRSKGTGGEKPQSESVEKGRRKAAERECAKGEDEKPRREREEGLRESSKAGENHRERE